MVATGAAVLFRLGVAGPITVSRAWECEEAIQFARPHPAGPFWVELQRGPGVVPWQGVPLAIFTQNVIGPIFFEIIQPKGSELDQMRRGVL